MLSIGACSMLQPRSSFYVELQPVNDHFTEEAMSIHRLSWNDWPKPVRSLRRQSPALPIGLPNRAPEGQRPVFVAFNAGFDWMFVSYYFYHYLGHNPFGHAPLDIKAYYMGKYGVSWAETSMRYVSPRFLGDQPLTHHALRDAIDQADIFIQLLEVSNGKG